MIFTDLLHGKSVEKPPIWIMRQAGRYLPEYREVRKPADNFISFCLTPEKACEVTLQPIKRYNFDASIIFSDILLVPHAMGREVKFIPGTGPVLEKLSNINELDLPDHTDFTDFLKPVSKAVKLTRTKLPKETALIGFSGAPWTLMTYIVEGEDRVILMRAETGYGQSQSKVRDYYAIWQIMWFLFDLTGKSRRKRINAF